MGMCLLASGHGPMGGTRARVVETTVPFPFDHEKIAVLELCFFLSGVGENRGSYQVPSLNPKIWES